MVGQHFCDNLVENITKIDGSILVGLGGARHFWNECDKGLV